MKKRFLFLLMGILLILSFESVSAQLAESPWPMFQHDPQHTGASLYVGPETNNLKEIFTFSSGITSGLIIDSKGTIYAAGAELGGLPVYAINPNGTIKWNVAVNTDFRGEPSGAGRFLEFGPVAITPDDTLYIWGNVNGYLSGYPSRAYIFYALNPDGTVKWFFNQSKFINLAYYKINKTHSYGEVLTTEDINFDQNGSIYLLLTKVGVEYRTDPCGRSIKNASYYLFSLAPTGEVRWVYNFSSSMHASKLAIGHNGNIYLSVLNNNNYYLMIFSQNGSVLLNKKMPQDFGVSSLAVGKDGTLYGGEKKLFAISPSGTLLWQKSIAGQYSADSPIITDTQVIVNNFFTDNANNSIQAFNFSGASKWVFKYPIYSIYGPIADKDGNIYFVRGNTNIFYALNPDGTLKWKLDNIKMSGFSPYTNLIIGFNNTIYLLGQGNNFTSSSKSALYALSSPQPSQPSCTDNIKNQNETDIDCGGNCEKCGNGKSCLHKADCLSNYCNPNKICSVPSCSDGIKNQDEIGIDCGGSCPACVLPPSCLDGIQNGYEEGIDCGGICPNVCELKLTILIIPVNWQGNYNSFKETALLESQHFLNRIPLKDCPNEYKLLISDETDYDKEHILWNGWKCYIPESPDEPGCFISNGQTISVIKSCAKRYKDFTNKKYDIVVGITDLGEISENWYVETNLLPPFNSKIKCKGYALGWIEGEITPTGIGKTTNAAIATTNDINVVSHELGHQLGFSEQYCDCTGVVKDGIDYSGLCGKNVLINPLSKSLGCDYDGDCCYYEFGDSSGCKWCSGNFDRFGEDTNDDGILDSGYRSIMSANVPRDNYDINEYTYLNNHLQCSGVSSLSANTLLQESTAFLSASPVNDSILEISLNVDKETNNVTVNYIDVRQGSPLDFPSVGGSYSLKIIDENNAILYESNFTLNIFVLTQQPYLTNSTHLYRKIAYDTSMRNIQLYHNDNLIFQQEINFCNSDGRCDSNENYFSCPNDCESWTNDGICNNDYDGVCDQDCLLGFDPDCSNTINISLNQNWNLISIPLILENNSIESVFGDIMDKVIVINGFEAGVGGGAKTYDPQLPEFSDLHNIDYLHGYWVKMNEGVNLSIEGTTPTNKTIILDENWNLISYLCDDVKPVEEVFGTIIDKVIVINGFENGALTYDPELPEFSDLQELKPNYGYWVKINQSAVLDSNIIC